MIQSELPGTTAEWADTDSTDGAAAPILGVGELGINTDTGAMSVGDGATAFASLPRIRPVKITTVTLVGGTKVTADTSIAAATVILPVLRTLGTVAAPKFITVTRSNGVSYTLTSTDGTDTSTFDVLIIQP